MKPAEADCRAGQMIITLALILLEVFETHWNQVVQNFAWAYAIVGITLVLIGLEILSLTPRLHAKAS
jgi:inner membrane protein involved in colicin E2 resistance